MNYDLPKSVKIDGESFAIRYDFRVILTIMELLNDQDLDATEKAVGMLEMFYVDPDRLRNAEEAVKECYTFINVGENSIAKKTPKVMDWDQDFNYIIAPVNRVLGYEARGVPYNYETNTGGLHWWTFMAAYMEIGGDCTFSQLVQMRDKRARGKKLEKYEKEWIQKNLDLIEFKHSYSETEKNLIAEWTGGAKHG